MAKIESVSIINKPDIINVSDDISDLTIRVSIKFHPIDIVNKMEYLLYIFVYDVHGKIDVPVIIGNWDDTDIYGVSQGGKDDFLGKAIIPINSSSPEIKVEKSMALKLGNLTRYSSYHTKKIEVFATLIPAIGRASKWSEPFECQIVYG